jgi:hypothetical protein
MKFGVVQCSRCKTAKGIRLETKSTKCPKCGKKLDLNKTKLLCKVDNEKELASVVMRYNTRLEGGEDIYAKDVNIVKERRFPSASNVKMSDIHTLIARKLIPIRARNEKIVAAAQELCRVLGEFTEQDLREVLKHVGIKEDDIPKKFIPRLIENNVIYEPKRGVYRCLESAR